MRVVSIFSKILALNIGLALVLTLGLVGAGAWVVGGSVDTQATDRLTSSQTSITEEVEDLRREFSGLAQALAENPAFAKAVATQDLPTLRTMLAPLRAHPLCDLATVTDAAGKVLLRGHADLAGDSMTGNALFRTALGGSPASGIETGAVLPLSLQAVSPVRHEGALAGAVSLGHSFASHAFVDRIKNRLGVACTIFKGDTRLSTTIMREGARSVGTRMENQEVLQRVLQQGVPFQARNTILGAEYDTLYWSLRNAAGQRVGMYFIGIPRTVTEALERRMLYSVAGISAGVLLLVVGASVLFARKLSRPIQQATAFATNVAAGDLRQQLHIAGQDEIGRLAEALRTMVDELKRRLAFAQGVLNGVSGGLPCAYVNTEGQIEFVNDKIVRLAGRSGAPETFRSMPVGEFIARDAKAETVSSQALQSRQRVERQIQLTTVDGGLHTLDVVANPIHDLDGNLTGVFTIYFDLTQLCSQQEALTQANASIQRVAGEACRMAELVSSATSQIAAQVEQTTKGADIQATRVQETSASMQQMAATVMEVAKSAAKASTNTNAATRTARQGEAVVKDVVHSISTMHGQIARLNDSMNILGTRAQGISQVITVIKDIADQTNLLALNAAIEAARAGDSGRGFAVVADEVRKLAEKTVRATQEVADAVTHIQSGVQTTVQATDLVRAQVEEAIDLAEHSGTSLQQVVRIIEDASAQVQSIAAASEEQSAASESIALAVEDVRRIADEMLHGMTESADAVTSLASQAQALQRLTRELSQ